MLDGMDGVGICGDWFTSSPAAGPCIETAWCSGKLLADAMANNLLDDGMLVKGDFGFESHVRFEACDGHPLGDVPGFVRDKKPVLSTTTSSTPVKKYVPRSMRK